MVRIGQLRLVFEKGKCIIHIPDMELFKAFDLFAGSGCVGNKIPGHRGQKY